MNIHDIANQILSGTYTEQCDCGTDMECNDINNDGAPDWHCKQCEEESNG